MTTTARKPTQEGNNRSTVSNDWENWINRRTLLKVGALGAVGGGLAGSNASAKPEPVFGSASDDADDWDSFTLSKQLDTVRAATEQYRDLAAVEEDGFETPPLPLLCGAGFHWDKVNRWDQEIDPEKPESLAYVLEGNTLVLGAVEYIFMTELVGGEPVDDPPQIFNDDNELLNQEPLMSTPESEGWELVEEDDLVFWDLHVWVHQPNPKGVFHHTNPDYEDMPGCVPIEGDIVESEPAEEDLSGCIRIDDDISGCIPVDEPYTNLSPLF